MEALSTACFSLDELLDGGLESDAITLVFGEGGSGKTNLALQCARQVALAGKRTAYVDTEGVSAVRLRQVFSGVASDRADAASMEAGAAGLDGATTPPDAGSTVADATDPGTVILEPASADHPTPAGVATDLESLMDRVLFYKPFTIEEQERLVQNATRGKDLGLIVVDSINMHYRLHIDAGDTEQEAGRSLYKQLHHLTNFARKHHVPVLVTGQVYGGEDTTQPFARRVMEHLVKALIRFEKRPDGSRRATVLKHRSIEEGRSARFRIGSQGLEDL